MLMKSFIKFCVLTKFALYKKFKTICVALSNRSDFTTYQFKISKPYIYSSKNFSCRIFLILSLSYSAFNKKIIRCVFVFFELELFFLSHNVFIFIFFIYSILNRVFLVFLFVLLCIKIS